ncbi:F-box protein At3g26010 isoform X3 [Musa acuminata AAA Group]
MSDDVCFEILARLPVEALFRFSCVSREWHRLISDDYLRWRLPLLASAVFYRCGDGESEKPRFACTSRGSLRECSLEFFPFHRSSAIVDCCHGLLLSYSSFHSMFYVVSPITMRWVELPRPPKRAQLSVLAFDPRHSSEYKVVAFTGWLPRGAELMVFASETGRWAERSVQWGLDPDAMTTTLRYFAGTLYILAHPNYAVAVDLGDDSVCRLIELPEAMKHGARLDMSAGGLQYACNDGGRLRVWMHNESSGGGWVLKHSVNVNGAVVALHPEREVAYLRADWKLVSYDLRKNKVEEVLEMEEERETACYVVNMWLFPFSRHMSDCLATRTVVEAYPSDVKEYSV